MRPDWLFLDESTSAVDEKLEAELYALSGIADRDVIAFRVHFEVALGKSDDCRAVTDGHYRRLRPPPGPMWRSGGVMETIA
jgi:hypothetical protein